MASTNALFTGTPHRPEDAAMRLPKLLYDLRQTTTPSVIVKRIALFVIKEVHGDIHVDFRNRI